MASERSVARLHRDRAPEPEPVKLPTVGNSQPAVPSENSMLELAERSLAQARQPVGRFVLPGETVSRFDAPATMMNGVLPTSVPMSRADFATLAARERLARHLERQARGGDHQQGGHGIQF